MNARKITAALLLSMSLVGSAMAAETPRPGQTPARPQTITLHTIAHITFPSPMLPGSVEMTNDAAAAGEVVYALSVTVDELMRQTGLTGYDDQAYAALVAEPGFDPKMSRIILCQTEPLAPGETVTEITLGALPSGQTLPAGTYRATLLMLPVEAEQSTTLTANIAVGANVEIPFTIESDSITLESDAEGNLPLRAFNPVSAGHDTVFSIQVSQQELQNVSGHPHRTEAELSAQQKNPNFDPAYEFISLFESVPVAPGEMISGATLNLLPDGQALPGGTYQGWLVRYKLDPATGEKIFDTVNTQIELVIG